LCLEAKSEWIKKLNKKTPIFFIKMKLRSGNVLNEDILYKSIKQRSSIVYPLEDVKTEQVAYVQNMLDSFRNGITKSNANSVLYTMMHVPEISAYNVNFRDSVFERINMILNHTPYNRIILPEYRKIYAEYFDWLKLRSDYVESEEERKVRIISNTQRMKQEVFERLFYPDRCDRMLLAYGDNWVDTHFN
jgi:hypothetical protein